MGHDEPKIFWQKFPDLPYTMVGRERMKFTILVALESLISHSLVLFQNQSQQYKQNLTYSNYVRGHFQ